MMKKIIAFFASLIMLTTVFAAEQTNEQILLYEQPNTSSKVIAKLNPDTQLVQIFQKDNEWVKVGDPANGNVGWLNEKQYHSVWSSFNQPTIQTVFVQYNKNTQDGKPEINIIAYRNGKKVSDKEAKALYEKIKQQNLAEQQQMQQFFNNMHTNMGQFFNRSGFGFSPMPYFLPSMHPMIIIDN